MSKTSLSFAEMLAGEYKNTFGEYPDNYTFYNEPDQFTLYKQIHFANLVFGKYRGQIQEQIIAPLQSAYLAGESKELVKLIDSAIKAEKIYHPAYFTGKFISILTFGKLGIKPGKGVRYADPSEVRNDDVFLRAVIFKVFFRSITQIEKFYTPLIHIESREYQNDFEDCYEPPPVACISPAPLEDVYDFDENEQVFEGEFEDIEDNENTEKETPPISRSEHSLKNVSELLSYFNEDSEAWNDPQTLLETIYNGLLAEISHYPDPDFLHEKIAFVSTCLLLLPDFDDEFERQMKLDENEELAEWMKQANFEYGDEILTLTGLEGLKRIALRHFLLSQNYNSQETETNETFTSPEGF